MSTPPTQAAGMNYPQKGGGLGFSDRGGNERDSVSLTPEAAAELRTRIRIRLEPAIDDRSHGKSPAELERLAATHYRWAKQFWRRAEILREELGLPPLPRRKPSAPSARRKARRAADAAHTPDLPWTSPLDDVPGVPI